MPSRERTPRKPVAYSSHKSSFGLGSLPDFDREHNRFSRLLQFVEDVDPGAGLEVSPFDGGLIQEKSAATALGLEYDLLRVH